MFQRITLFILTNLLVITAISIIMSVFGIGDYTTEAGIDYTSLMVFCLVWGLVGSLISLALSRVMAKWMMKVKVIDPQSAGEFDWYVNMIHDLAKRAHLPAMPEVGIFESSDVNAFATGPTKSRSLVASSTALLRQMNRDQIEGVMAHEIAHIQNGDMVTMTLIQGVVNAFVMFFARIIAFALSTRIDAKARWIVNFIVIIVLQIAFGFLGMLVTGWFSRKREFRADAGSASLVGREKMISALEALKSVAGKIELREDERHESLAALQISQNQKQSSFKALFSTHPPLDDRIAALSAAQTR